jgi:type IV pilus assembly protein PilW
MNKLRSSHRCLSAQRRQSGLSLIELMVALVIASVITLAIFGVMSTFEGRKRTTTTMNDASQSGNYAAYLVDKYIRSAGSGFVQAGPRPNLEDEERYAVAFGCRLLASQSGTTLLPKGAALDPPFENVNTTGTAGTFRLAPVIIAPSQSRGRGFNNERSDVLVVMAGTGGFGEVPIPLTGPISAGTMPVNSTLSLQSGDLLLLADQLAPTDDVDNCMLQQIQAGAVSSPVGLSGAYTAATISGVSNSSYDDKSVAMKIGNSTDNRPNFLVIGVGDNNTLVSYDLLETRSPALQAIADSVFELHAVYGVDRDGDGIIDDWFDPRSTATDDFQMSSLMAGTGPAADRIGRIKAIRVAMILRTSLQEKATDAAAAPFTPASYTLFSEVGLARVRNLSDEERRFRYRIIESTIPVRNGLLVPRM